MTNDLKYIFFDKIEVQIIHFKIWLLLTKMDIKIWLIKQELY